PGRTIVSAPGLHRRGIKGIDGRAGRRDEGHMHRPTLGLALADPKGRLLTGAEADRPALAAPLLRRDLHDDAVTEGAERLQIELGGAGDVAPVQPDMVDPPPRSTICRFSEEMAAAGLRPFGQALVQLRMVWQR